MTASAVNPLVEPSVSLLASGSDWEYQAGNFPGRSVSPSGMSSHEASQASAYSLKVGSNLASEVAPPILSDNMVPSKAAANVVASKPLVLATIPSVKGVSLTMTNAIVE